MPFTVYTSDNKAIRLEDVPIASAGAEGTVYRVITNLTYPSHCAKIFHKEKATDTRKSKIAFMINNKPPVLRGEQFMICWPTELLFDSLKKFIGFIMPMAFSDSIQLYELTTTNTSKKLHVNWHKFNRSNQAGIINRIKICVNLSSALKTIHESGKYAIVDFKPQNILINVTGHISIIDVDSIQISNISNVLYHSEVATPEYAPPESARLNPSQNYIPETWDRFSLAVCIYEILFGIHPYTATCDGQYSNVVTIGEKIQKGLFVHGSKKVYISVLPPIHNNFNAYPASVRYLFIKSFEDGHTNPTLRPTSEDWGKELFVAINEKSILPGKVQPPKKTPPKQQPNPTTPPKIPYHPPKPTITTYKSTSELERKEKVFTLYLIIVSALVAGYVILYSLAQHRKY
jgi:DNA-binding helix-hairpin-helix protein with protein kinase domain